MNCSLNNQSADEIKRHDYFVITKVVPTILFFVMNFVLFVSHPRISKVTVCTTDKIERYAIRYEVHEKKKKKEHPDERASRPGGPARRTTHDRQKTSHNITSS